MLVGMMAGAFAMHTKAAFAAPAVDCVTPVSGGIVAGTPSCDVAITTTPVGVTGLSFTADASIAATSAAVGSLSSFTFGATVTDVRETDDGWQLQATSPGLVNPLRSTVFFPITLGATGSTATCTVTATPVIAGSVCPDATFTPVAIGSTTPATFATETPVTASNVSGIDVLGVAGTYTIPIGAFPGNYGGTITLSLLNTF